MQIHGFCDASQRSYGACVYVCTRIRPDKSIRIRFVRDCTPQGCVIAATRVICSLTLTRLIAKISESFDLTQIPLFLWSDSTITLNTSPSRRWSVFVANRIGEIQRLTKIQNWRHVISSNNPADILLRGLNSRELSISSTWWQGPDFLQLSGDRWPSSHFTLLEVDVPKQVRIIVALVTFNHNIVDELLSKCSNLNRVCRIIAYCLRFSKRHRLSEPTSFVSPVEKCPLQWILCAGRANASVSW